MVLNTMRGLATSLALVLAIATPARAEQQAPLPTWFDAARQPSAQALEAIALLRNAADHGLEATDYRAQALAEAAQRLMQPDAAADTQRLRFDLALNDAMLRFLTDLQAGRVTPAQLGAAFAPMQRPLRDAAQLLRSARADNRLSGAVQSLTQQLPMAQPLQLALQQYRTLAQSTGWQAPLPRPAGGKLVEGDTYRALAELEQRLTLLGDLPSRAAPQQVDAELIAAVRRFQQRHGLEPDGVVGRLTLAQLDVTPAQRARQIAITLERLRWTPLLQGRRMIVVNVPEFLLRAYAVEAGRIAMQLEMKIIVGKALDTRTPLFDEDMRYIEFSPYWNVPRSIALGETLPRLRKDPAYFAQQGFEFVTPERQVVTTLTDAAIAAVQDGRWRIRQRPGAMNALGAIKFIFPNNANIYLHHTPAPRLFARERRDFSHGCIRVEAPVALARFVLQDDPHWNHERIEEAMTAGVSRTIRLREPLPVLIAYSTVVVKHGLVFFYDDLYGHDRLLDQALQARSAALARLPNLLDGG
jgi:murein L,D-transpeptidase YcbB/YkuD